MQSEGQRLTHIIHIASNDVHVGRQCPKEVILLFGAEVASAEHMLHLVGHQHLLEFFGNVRCAVWQVKVTQHQYKLSIDDAQNIQAMIVGE
jgi:hypothetical protein